MSQYPDPYFSNNIIISPPFPCGMSIVMELLLRLDILVQLAGYQPSRPGIFNPSWENTRKGYRMTDYAARSLSKSLSIDADRVFTFHDKIGFTCEHQLTLIGRTADNYFMIVRDPVDAVLAAYKREQNLLGQNSLTFHQFCQRPMYLNGHLPYRSFLLSPLDMYSIHVLFCMAAYPDIKIIRFEDLIRDPGRVIVDILQTVNCSRNDKQICDAVSSVLIRSKKTYEWPDYMTRDEHDTVIASQPIVSLSKILMYITEEGNGNDIFSFQSNVMLFFVNIVDNLKISDVIDIGLFLTKIRRCMFSIGLDKLSVVGSTYDRREVNAFDSIMGVANLLEMVFKDNPSQPSCMLKRIMVKMSCVIANCSDNVNFRYFFEGIRSFTPSVDEYLTKRETRIDKILSIVTDTDITDSHKIAIILRTITGEIKRIGNEVNINELVKFVYLDTNFDAQADKGWIDAVIQSTQFCLRYLALGVPAEQIHKSMVRQGINKELSQSVIRYILKNGYHIRSTC
ncbi:MAG: sulfotransferase [Magnetococcus sp. YQC-5]